MFSESAELYDAIYSTFKDYAAEADAIAALVRRTHDGARTVLDVGCGTGEHAKHLRFRHGFEVDGLDLDPGLLAFARRKVPDAHFVVADMAAFDLGRRYDVIACMFSSIGYLKTANRVTAALACFHRHLNTGGVVIVEPWFPPGVLRTGSGATRSGEVNGVRVERNSRTEISGNISTLTFTYRIEDANGSRTTEEVHELGLFTPAEMLGCFREAGLTATYDPVGLFDNRGLYVARAVA
jgi:SAM-dependent methyltransferase